MALSSLERKFAANALGEAGARFGGRAQAGHETELRCDLDRDHSASGCFSGAVSAKAGRAWHAASMRTSVGYAERSMRPRRAL